MRGCDPLDSTRLALAVPHRQGQVGRSIGVSPVPVAAVLRPDSARGGGRITRIAAAGLIGLVLGMAGSPVARATETMMSADAPYWMVGPRDKDLSALCALGEFNQIRIERYVIRLYAKKGGSAVLGLARGTGVNLKDPKHKAHTDEDYYFKDDMTSSCEVFVGGRTQKPPGSGAKDATGTPPVAPSGSPSRDDQAPTVINRPPA